ncbi:MAG: DUF4843 domain-containing protein [Prevotellaceae bacterium]|jgi:hypothetical protein|nr:DUF4843 domain-containing protein [Prevotellaceae bacterium]
MKYLNYIIIILSVISLYGCENEEYLYRDISSRIWLGETYHSGNLIITRDSTTSSFMMFDVAVETDTLFVTANVTGQKTDFDRPFLLEIVPEETNVPSGAYTIAPTIIPANSFTGKIPVIVNKNIPGLNLRTDMARLTLRFVPNENFLYAVPNTDIFKLLWCDFLTKPDSWSYNITQSLGEFSQARYKFIIDYAKETEFYRYQSNPMALQALQSYLRKTLAEYNLAHDKQYMDDNELPLTF